jgi:hypothetical protein
MSVPAKPLDITLEIAPKARFDVVDLRSQFAAEHEALGDYQNCLYWSFHTTAGFLDRSLAARLKEQHIPTYVEAVRTFFPEGAGYEHDRLERRGDLDSAQRAVEPRNADSHLAFMAGGLRTCVTHPNRPNEPVYFVDLDGVNEGRPRRRLARLIAFTRERVVRSTRIEVPVSEHPIDSINLKDPRLGIYSQLATFVKEAGVEKGRLRVTLDPTERGSALTVNEYETLLMRYDLAEVLRNPLRFVAEKSRHALADPLAVPNKALGYAKYAMVRVLRDYVRKNGFRGVVLGLSGGIDSALTAAVAVDALGADRVRGVRLPSRFTSAASQDDAAASACAPVKAPRRCPNNWLSMRSLGTVPQLNGREVLSLRGDA